MAKAKVNWFTVSIHAQLTLFIGLLAAALVIVTSFAAIRMVGIDRAATDIDRKWLGGRSALGDMRNELAHVRIAEISRALAERSGDRRRFEQAVATNAAAVRKAQRRYSALPGSPRVNRQRRELRLAVQAYLSAHGRWVAADRDGALDAPARQRGSLDRLYESASAAATRSIEANGIASENAGRSIEGLVHSTLYILLGVALLALLAAAWLLRQVKHSVTDPLRAITAALSRLAAGDRDIKVPERERNDEIGQMAQAFDVFRANALALEEAHRLARIAQDQAQILARHDALTGLPNRRLLATELDSALREVREGSLAYALLLLDLDRFKPVNDLHGHAAGDIVLCEVAERLKRHAGDDDTVARLGGDEFAFIAAVPALDPGMFAMRRAQDILSSIRAPIAIGGMSVAIDASIGIALFEAGTDSTDDLLRAADIAMYRAKRERRGTIRLFEHSMEEELRAQAALEADLHEAIAAGMIVSHYQPIIDLRDDSIYGFEILSRWRHPVQGSVPPTQFIRMAEQMGLIADLTWSVLRQACRAARAWPRHVHLSLNISPFHLKDPLLAVRLLAILTEEGLSPHSLDVEVTESALVEDLPTAKAILTSLQNIGVKVALDDFGTGYSSLSHLQELRFDKVKIDRSFVQTMCNRPESEKIVDAILNLARSLEMPVVAEGIEQPGVARLLLEKGCEFGQGYYFGAPMDVNAAASLLEDDRRPCRALASM